MQLLKSIIWVILLLATFKHHRRFSAMFRPLYMQMDNLPFFFEQSIQLSAPPISFRVMANVDKLHLKGLLVIEASAVILNLT
jgi:hypothetical protein